MGGYLSDIFDEPDDAPPLEPEEREGLLRTWITCRRDLNEAEQTNIAAGTAWARRARRRDLLSEEFLRRLHKRLFGDVRARAGAFRRTGRNIGIEPARIPVELGTVFDDARYWIEHETFPSDEIAVCLHHRLVAIHPFPDGNGRTTRRMGDLAAARPGRESFTWGRRNLTDVSETRARYVAALQAADSHDVRPLLEFARSWGVGAMRDRREVQRWLEKGANRHPSQRNLYTKVNKRLGF